VSFEILAGLNVAKAAWLVIFSIRSLKQTAINFLDFIYSRCFQATDKLCFPFYLALASLFLSFQVYPFI